MKYAQLQGNWPRYAQYEFSWTTEVAFSRYLARMEDVKINSHDSIVQKKRKLTLSGEAENDFMEERTCELVW